MLKKVLFLTPKKIFNIDMWTTAFLRFMAIYTEQFSFEAPQLLKNAEIVCDLACCTQNLSWYTYDQGFHTLRETVQIPWGRIHTEFWIMASHSQPQQCPDEAKTSITRSDQWLLQYIICFINQIICWYINKCSWLMDGFWLRIWVEYMHLKTTKEVLAIRCIFVLIDMLTNTKFSSCPNVLKLV